MKVIIHDTAFGIWNGKTAIVKLKTWDGVIVELNDPRTNRWDDFFLRSYEVEEVVEKPPVRIQINGFHQHEPTYVLDSVEALSECPTGQATLWYGPCPKCGVVSRYDVGPDTCMSLIWTFQCCGYQLTYASFVAMARQRPYFNGVY